MIPVDGILTSSDDILVDESLLTGEARGVAKKTGDLLYSGTYLSRGSATVIAERVGS